MSNFKKKNVGPYVRILKKRAGRVRVGDVIAPESLHCEFFKVFEIEKHYGKDHPDQGFVEDWKREGFDLSKTTLVDFYDANGNCRLPVMLAGEVVDVVHKDDVERLEQFYTGF